MKAHVCRRFGSVPLEKKNLVDARVQDKGRVQRFLGFEGTYLILLQIPTLASSRGQKPRIRRSSGLLAPNSTVLFVFNYAEILQRIESRIRSPVASRSSTCRDSSVTISAIDDKSPHNFDRFNSCLDSWIRFLFCFENACICGGFEHSAWRCETSSSLDASYTSTND